ncbi:unnamed protein product [Schistosoma curassoni]|nr:unnamed protein product [Schistosoma curassoni]
MHTRLFEMHPFLPIRSLFKLFYITSAFCTLFRPDVFRFNHDDVVCEGDHYLFNCELSEYLADGVLGIYKLENEFIPANLSAREKEVAEIFKKDPYPNLVIWSLREIFEEHGVHKWNQTYDRDHKTFKYRYGPLTQNDSGLYYCRFIIPGEYSTLMSTYMKLEVNMKCPKPSINWILRLFPYFLFFVFISLILQLVWLWRRKSEIITYKLISIGRSIEYYEFTTGDAQVSNNNNSDNNSFENTTSLMLDPINKPVINIKTIVTRRPPKFINKIKERCTTNRYVTSPSQQQFYNRFTHEKDIQRLKELDKLFLSNYQLEKDEHYEFSRKNLQLTCRLGSGAFGIVYRGVAENLPNCVNPNEKIDVAVKTLKDDFTEEHVSEFLMEVNIMKQLRHKHIIEFYGVCTENGSPLLIMEYAPYGNLKEYLRRHREIWLNCDNLSLKLLNFGCQVANGMKYLESKCLIHRDLAARNILVGKHCQLKIADFGLTRFAENYYRKVKNGRVPLKWLAPESLGDKIYTIKSDVWSFGILLWEIFTLGSSPYPNINVTGIIHSIQSGVRNEKPLLASNTIYQIMCNCWQFDPKERLSFSELVNLLELQINEHDDRTEISETTSGISTYHDDDNHNNYNSDLLTNNNDKNNKLDMNISITTNGYGSFDFSDDDQQSDEYVHHPILSTAFTSVYCEMRA